MLSALRQRFQLMSGLRRLRSSGHSTFAFQFERLARSRRADQAFLLFGEQSFSYRQGNALVNRHAHAYRGLGLERGDTLALIFDNRPEFLWHFLAAGKLGLTASLINPHNVGAPLLHSLRICKPKLIVVGSEHAPAFAEIAHELDPAVRVLLDEDPAEAASSLLPELARFASFSERAAESDPPETDRQRLDELAAYIYTSGTTGLPKAARIRHLRLCLMGHIFAHAAFGLRPGDVVYNCLPLYHSSGMGNGVGAVITGGATLALGRGFSASRFWDEIRSYRATGFTYIGELCRYLMAQPERASDREHGARVMVGNGLRPDIWPRFVARFGIEHVREFYGATEGNFASLNLDDTVGSVGRLFRGALARWDEDKADFVRRSDGFLVKCKAGEPGVLLAPITRRNFDGYEDARETEKKIVRNAWKRGDAWFNSGDLLRKDESGRLYFVDRIGDTFRWKGENVSTFEVQEQIAGWPLALEVNVYGVNVPGTEGRAGMVALALRGEFDPVSFKQHVDAALASYARPVFVRVQDKLALTSTFKLKKAELRAEGFDPAQVQDRLYMRDPALDAYVALTPELYARIHEGALRF